MRAAQGASPNCRTRLSRSRRAAEADCTLRHATICSCCGCCSNEGRIGSARLLSAASVRELTRDQVAGLPVERQRSAAQQHTHDFVFMDGTQKFGLGVLIETRNRPTGRAAGSYGWAGIYNTYFWVDTRASLAAVVLTQWRPFCAPQSIQICDEIEASAYESFASR